MSAPKFVSGSTLTQWNLVREAVLEADSSGYALGKCLILRQDNGSKKPVINCTQKLIGAEMIYEIYDKELLAIIACVKE